MSVPAGVGGNPDGPPRAEPGDGSYDGRLTTPAAIDTAAQLLNLFDLGDPRFSAGFFAADRDVLGALVCFAALGIHQVAERDGIERPAMVLLFLEHLKAEQGLIGQIGEMP